MEEILASYVIDDHHSIHIAALARQTIIDAGAEHLGFGGYFVFESNDSPNLNGISVLGKALSLDAAFRMIEIWGNRPS